MINLAIRLFISLSSVFTVAVFLIYFIKSSHEEKLNINSSNMKYIEKTIFINPNETTICSNDYILKEAKNNKLLLDCNPISTTSFDILILPINSFVEYSKKYVIINKLNEKNIIAINRELVSNDYIKKAVLNMFGNKDTISMEMAIKIANSVELENELKNINLEPFSNLNYSYFKDTNKIEKVIEKKVVVKQNISTMAACNSGYIFDNNTQKCIQEINNSKEEIKNDSLTKEFDSPFKTMLEQMQDSNIFKIVFGLMLALGLFMFLTGNAFAGFHLLLMCVLAKTILTILI